MYCMPPCRTGKLTPEVESIVQRIKSAAEASPMQPKPGMIDGRFAFWGPQQASNRAQCNNSAMNDLACRLQIGASGGV